MLKRKIDQYLIRWKDNPDRLPLIIKGARQIGKTFSIEHFAKNYKNFIEINFIAEFFLMKSRLVLIVPPALNFLKSMDDMM